MGPSGSGKSTLLHCLAALDTPTSGRVFLGQTELTSLSRRQQAQVRRDRIGFVFQAFNLVPTLDAIENITLPQLLAGRRPNKEWLEYVVAQIGLGDRLHHRPSQLSGGQQQRVALARALAGRPEVIFADEPTGNLDTRASREMLSLLRSAVDDFRQTVVTVTHDPAIAGYADQVLFFTDGQVVDQVLHPEPDLVLEHLQYLDFSTPAHRGSRGQLHASMQPDGQDMRSRRRRRADETGPGRPMVGSDDEVEVARQERWLERIREQFEVEHEAAHARDPADATHHTGNGFNPDPAPADNGYHPEPRHDTTAGSPDTLHTTSNGFQGSAPHHADNGYHSDATYHTGNGHAHTQAMGVGADDDWLPPERSWLSDTGHAADIERPDTGQHNGVAETWSQPRPVADAYPTRQSPEPAAERWHTNDWNHPQPEQQPHPNADTGRRDAWASADPYTDSGAWRSTAHPAGPAPDDPSPVTPIRSWREVRAQDSIDDVWSAPSDPAQGEWPTVTPLEPAAGQWDTPGAPERNGWQPQPPEQHAEPTGPPIANGDGGWQRWQPDPYAPDNGAEPVRNGRYHDEDHYDVPNDQRPSNRDEPHQQSHEPLDTPRRQSTQNNIDQWQAGEPAVEVREVRPDEQSSDGWYAPHDNRANASNQQEHVVDPVRELLDIWSPNGTGDDGWSSDQSPIDTGTFGGDPQEPAPFESAPVQRGGLSAEPPSPAADEWPSEPAPLGHHEPYPPPSQSYSGTTTDPFEALQSLQSQLNRLGGGRRAPRHYEE